MPEAVIVIENTKLLIPNKDHKNFTESKEIVPEGATLVGKYVKVEGNRKGEPFTYRLFKLENIEKYIYQKSIKPNKMEKTEVTLGADAVVSPTKIDVPSNKNANRGPIIGAVVGAVAGFGFAKYRKVEGNAKWIYMGVGAVAGFMVAKMIVKRKAIKVVPSK